MTDASPMTRLAVIERPDEPVTEPVADEPAVETALPRPSSTRRDVGIVIATGCLVFGILVIAFAVYLFALSSLEHGRSQRSLLEQFDAGLENGATPIGGRVDEGTPIAVLEIPSIGVREAVVEGTSSTQLKKAPGHFRASPFPGQAGNVVIGGRRTTFGAPFRNVDDLERGDEIRFETGQGEMVYRVRTTETISRGDDDVLQQTNDDRLTLITSVPLLAAQRYVVVAELRGDPVASPAGRPTEVRSSELGLNSEGGLLLPLVLWLQVLLVAAIGTVWLLRNYRRPSVYLVMTPILLLLLLLVFDSTTALLPSTL